jgi:hypothetical protein
MISPAHSFRGFLRYGIPIFFAIVLNGAVQSQSTGQVRIFSVPDRGLEYVLDGKYRMTDRQLTLPEGDHRFVFWAPEHAMFDTTVFVMGNWTTNLEIRLRRPVEYIAFRQAMERHHRQQRMARVLPPIVAGGFGVWAAVSTIRYGRAHSDLKDMKVRYADLADPAGIQRLKEEEIPDARQRFVSTRNQTFISSGLFVASLGTAAYLRRKMARKPPPVYQDMERIRFEGLAWVPGASGGFWTAGLVIPIR